MNTKIAIGPHGAIPTLENTTMAPTKLSKLLWRYEDNAPHAMTEAYMDHGSLYCKACECCVQDHDPVDHNISHTYYNFEGEVKVRAWHNGNVTKTDENWDRVTLKLIDEDVNY